MPRYNALMLAAFIVAGCDVVPEFDWQAAPRTHTCTSEQMVKVERESAWCKANTGYYDTYCYGAAILRNCTKRGTP